MATLASVDPATLPGAASNRNVAVSITTGASVVLADPTGQFWPTGIPVTIESAGGGGAGSSFNLWAGNWKWSTNHDVSVDTGPGTMFLSDSDPDTGFYTLAVHYFDTNGAEHRLAMEYLTVGDVLFAQHGDNWDDPNADSDRCEVLGWAENASSTMVLLTVSVSVVDGLPDDAPVKFGWSFTRGETGSSAMAINDLTDVDTANNAPIVGQTLMWDGSQWIPGTDNPVRQTTTDTSVNLPPNIPNNTGLDLAASAYRIYRVAANAPCRVRLYTSWDKASYDEDRPIGTDPTGDHGLVLEVVLTASLLSLDLSPAVDGFYGLGASGVNNIPYTVTNTGASTATIAVTFTWIRTE